MDPSGGANADVVFREKLINEKRIAARSRGDVEVYGKGGLAGAQDTMSAPSLPSTILPVDFRLASMTKGYSWTLNGQQDVRTTKPTPVPGSEVGSSGTNRKLLNLQRQDMAAMASRNTMAAGKEF